jgi:acyl-CoA thioesterase
MTIPADMTPDELAQACADEMWKNDDASRGLGMGVVEITSGKAVLRMKVRKDMTNSHDICHGGFMFLLADSAFAFACNGYNQITVAQHCSIDFLKPAFENETLIATALERQKSHRSGIYDVTIERENGDIVAEFRGNSRTIKGQHLPDFTNETTN